MMKSLYISCLHPAADSRASKSGVASQRFAGTCAAIVSPYVHSVNMKDMSDSLKPLSATPAPLVRGNVVNTASSTNIQPEWAPVVSHATAGLLTALHSSGVAEGDVLGVYLRGSIPQGTAAQNISDVDLSAYILISTSPPHVYSSDSVDGHSKSSTQEAQVKATKRSLLESIVPAANRRAAAAETVVASDAAVGYQNGLRDRVPHEQERCGSKAKVHMHVDRKIVLDNVATARATCEAQFPFCAKVEMKVVPIDRNSLHGRYLSRLQISHDATIQPQCMDINGGRHRSTQHALLPHVIVDRLPGAFELAAASIVLHGLDLPELLPRYAAAPQRTGLLSVKDAVKCAVKEVEQHGDYTDDSVSGHEFACMYRMRAVRWAIKQLIRAAFELVMARADTYTRDLYWCCSEVERNLPEHFEKLNASAPSGVRAHMHAQMQAVKDCCSGEAASDPCTSESSCNLLCACEASNLISGQLWSLLGTYIQADPCIHTSNYAKTTLSRCMAVARAFEAAAFADAIEVPKGWPCSDAYDRCIAARMAPQVSGHKGNSHGCKGTSALPRSRRGEISSRIQEVIARWGGKVRTVTMHAHAVLLALGGYFHKNMAGTSPLEASYLRIQCHTTASNMRHNEHLQARIKCEDTHENAPVLQRLRKTPLHEYNWRDPCDQQKLRTLFQNLREAPESIAHIEPFVIRGGAASWRACMGTMHGEKKWESSGGWTVDELVLRGGGLGGITRVAPTLQFPFVMPAHACEMVRQTGTDAILPSTTRKITLAEWSLRSLEDPPIPPLGPDCTASLVYHNDSACMSSSVGTGGNPKPRESLSSMYNSSAATTDRQPHKEKFKSIENKLKSSRSEWLYMQADLTAGSPLLNDIDFSIEPFSLIYSAQGASDGTQGATTAHGEHALHVTQQPRLWVSPQGAVTPLHYDRSISVLTQAMGKKRMLFVCPDDLHRLAPFPKDHILARRCQNSIFCTNKLSDPAQNSSMLGATGQKAKDSAQHGAEYSRRSPDEGTAGIGECVDLSVPDDLFYAGKGQVDNRGSVVEEDHVGTDLNVKEVVLEAGDVVLFGPFWAHWVSSETVSASVTVRVGAH